MLPSLRLRPQAQPWLLSAALVAFSLPLMTIPMVPQPAASQESQQTLVRTLTVTGQGQEEVMTTQAEVNLGIEVQAKTAADAQAEAARRSDGVVKFLKAEKVEKLQTTGVNLSPRYNYNDGQQTLVGYTATNTVSFRIGNDAAGAVMDGAVKAGATRIDGIRFVAEDQAIAQAQKQALREATADARGQADTVLDALGLDAKEIISIQVNGAQPPQPPMPIMLRSAQAFADAAPTTPILAGEQQVNASVTLQIRY